MIFIVLLHFLLSFIAASKPNALDKLSVEFCLGNDFLLISKNYLENGPKYSSGSVFNYLRQGKPVPKTLRPIDRKLPNTADIIKPDPLPITQPKPKTQIPIVYPNNNYYFPQQPRPHVIVPVHAVHIPVIVNYYYANNAIFNYACHVVQKYSLPLNRQVNVVPIPPLAFHGNLSFELYKGTLVNIIKYVTTLSRLEDVGCILLRNDEPVSSSCYVMIPSNNSGVDLIASNFSGAKTVRFKLFSKDLVQNLKKLNDILNESIDIYNAILAITFSHGKTLRFFSIIFKHHCTFDIYYLESIFGSFFDNKTKFLNFN